MTLSVNEIAYNTVYKVIGKHPVDGRLFAVKYDNTNGLYVVDRDLNLVTTLSTTFNNSDYYNYGFGINECIILSSGTMLAWGIYRTGKNQTVMWRSTDNSYSTFEPVFSLPTTIGFIERSVGYSTTDDTIMFCEYTMVGKDGTTNLWLDPQQLNIWRGSNDGQTWDVVFTRNRNPQFVGDIEKIRHFHSVRYDSFANLFWFCAGDADVENTIWTITPDGLTVNLIAQGTAGYSSQEKRTTSIIFTEDYVWWGSDSFITGQHPFSRYDRQTGLIEYLMEPDDCIRISESITRLNGETALIANKSYEKSPTNTGYTSDLYVCDDLTTGVWYSLFKWSVANPNDVSVFFQLVDNEDGRIFIDCRNIVDGTGTNRKRITAIVDINDYEKTLSAYTDAGILNYPLYLDSTGDKSGMKINCGEVYIVGTKELTGGEIGIKTP